MRTLNYYIKEAFKVTAGTKINKLTEYHYHPKTKKELKELVDNLIEERGSEADLNDIDTSKITDMSNLFYKSEFNGDISQWDVSNVIKMESMFFKSKFNGDISNWDVSNVTNMWSMFAYSKFNRDISDWDVSKVEDMSYMFLQSKFNGDISDWDVSSIEYTTHMFNDCPLEKQSKKQPKFNGVNMSNCIFPGRSRLPSLKLSKWDVSKVRNASDLFRNV